MPSGSRAVAASDCSTTASSSRRLPGHGYSRRNASASALKPRGASRRARAQPRRCSRRSARSARCARAAAAGGSRSSRARARAGRRARAPSVEAREPAQGRRAHPGRRPRSSQVASSRCARGASAPTSSSQTDRLGRRGCARPSVEQRALDLARPRLGAARDVRERAVARCRRSRAGSGPARRGRCPARRARARARRRGAGRARAAARAARGRRARARSAPPRLAPRALRERAAARRGRPHRARELVGARRVGAGSRSASWSNCAYARVGLVPVADQHPARGREPDALAVGELELGLQVAGEPEQHHVGGRRRVEERIGRRARAPLPSCRRAGAARRARGLRDGRSRGAC